MPAKNSTSLQLPTPLVIDCGSWTTKAGFGGEDAPRHECRTVVGRPRHPGTPASILIGQSDVAGDTALAHRGLLTVERVVQRGRVQPHAWPQVEQLLHSLYATSLKVPPEDHPLILTEAPDTTRQDRERFAAILFETLNVPAAVLANSGTLTTYASGRTTGVAVESGAERTHVVPVWEGYALPHATQRMDCGGNDITWALADRLRGEGYAVSTEADFDNLNADKEATSMCYVARDYKAEVDKFRQLTAARRATAPFTLPDGHTVHVADQRFLLPEMLFRFDLIPDERYYFAEEKIAKEGRILGAPLTPTSALAVGSRCDGLSSVLLEAVRLADTALHQELLGNIVLGGGNSLLAGFDDRLQREIAGAVPGSVVVRTMSFPCRKYSAWLGGSVLGTVSTLPCMWTSKGEYEEEGASIVHTKWI
jgi:actin